ncbi:calcium-dependent protein kinase 13-like isoform X1 [Panicum virgatum]|uniref:Uncharacterized protein n=1 Tax=Panicum virgatum TaxID=38727 RepID=A0A8T0VGD1_PANVG|nr:calcium-dependent protein kinase 13-like isoform X1 [Panicum virgatum]KAG2633467.1 hypothetical protein PVAP13_2NG270300 [Panicum virgatum]
MGNACGGTLRSKHLHSFKCAASQRQDSEYSAAAAADSPKKPASRAPMPPAAATTTDAHAGHASVSPTAGMRIDGAGAPPDLGSVLGHPTPNLCDLYAQGRKLGQGQFGTTYLCTELATGSTTRRCLAGPPVDSGRLEVKIRRVGVLLRPGGRVGAPPRARAAPASGAGRRSPRARGRELRRGRAGKSSAAGTGTSGGAARGGRAGAEMGGYC